MKTLLFAGTYEGRILCRRLSAAGLAATAFTATEYGAAGLAGLPGIEVQARRLGPEDMLDLIGNRSFDLVVDATHPYARLVSENIAEACRRAGVEKLRLLREEGRYDHLVTVPDTAGAVNFLTETSGRVLLTTGSKELAAYRALPDYRERLFARVLPSAEVLAHCEALGFSGDRLIAMQGPFSHDLNLALLKHLDCRWLVTKNTGAAGGLEEKISAAEALGAGVLMIDRPTRESGLTLEEVWARLNPRGNE